MRAEVDAAAIFAVADRPAFLRSKTQAANKASSRFGWRMQVAHRVVHMRYARVRRRAGAAGRGRGRARLDAITASRAVSHNLRLGASDRLDAVASPSHADRIRRNRVDEYTTAACDRRGARHAQ